MHAYTLYSATYIHSTPDMRSLELPRPRERRLYFTKFRQEGKFAFKSTGAAPIIRQPKIWDPFRPPLAGKRYTDVESKGK